MNEFDLIRRYFAPLAAGFPGARGLADDAALLNVPPGQQLVVTADALNAGTHFLGSEDANLIAQKALRVNLSDLAAMGAEPWCYFLTLALPRATDEAWVARFAEGLREDQERFGVALAGGDTTAIDGPLSISITALGKVPTGMALPRSGAREGDRIFVSGTLGEAAMGLRSLRGEIPRNPVAEQRYLLPEPRVTLGISLRGTATAAMDVSDGLAQDLGHLCTASRVGAELWAETLPRISADAETALCGGDDYELLFTLPPHTEAPEDVTQIGVITTGDGVRILDARGEPLTFAQRGWRHF